MMKSDQTLISSKFYFFINLFQGYQFWTQADKKGYFIIKNVLPGEYNLYAWVPGFIGDYKNDITITINPG
jgi:rhamnogalacturonan endolyase